MSVRSQSFNNLFNSKRGRAVRENLTAYLFLLPAGFLMLLFGVGPVAFAFFVSLHDWRRFPDEYVGLANYQEALGNFGYILFFWIAIGALVFGLLTLRRIWRKTQEAAEPDERMGLVFALPAIANTLALLLAHDWFFSLLVDVMEIPRRIRGQEVNLDLFMGELQVSFQIPEVINVGNEMLLAIFTAVLLSAVFYQVFRLKHRAFYLLQFTIAGVMLAAFFLLMQLSVTEIQAAVEAARADGEQLPLWSQLVFMSLGAVMIGVAWVVWQRGIKAINNTKFILLTLAGLMLAVGGYILLAEFPVVLAEADDDLLSGFTVTVMYALGTVPFQLAIGLGLAVLLFQKIRGKDFFRVVYFIPYITPFVATSIVFRIFFSGRETSLANKALDIVGIESQTWLLERTPIGELLFGPGAPAWLAGPSLALIVIMIYTTWTYIGYDAVIFLAGLGNIPTELYEAARIDGASGWRVFRHITLPLLSPTTFFLSLIAIIGTFKAFVQIWIMRTPSAGPSVDTASVYIFDELQTTAQYGYASAMAFVLFAVIMMLTLAQNRFAARRVFYG